MIACLLMAMFSALRTFGLSKGACVRVVGEIADIEAFLLHHGDVVALSFMACMSAGFG
jgi:hypothetical protein